MASDVKNVPSCDGRRYAGTASARNFAALGAFAEATGTDLAWHLNPTIRDGAGVFDGAAAASLPAETRAVLLFEELHRRPSASKSKLKEAPTAASLAADFRSLRRSFAGTVVGVLNQDADEDAAWTDEAYAATRGDVDRVAFSYYASSEFLPRKRKHEGCAAYGAARTDVAAGVVDAGHGARFDAVAARYAALARRLGKPAPWAVAVAKCRSPLRAICEEVPPNLRVTFHFDFIEGVRDSGSDRKRGLPLSMAAVPAGGTLVAASF